MKLTEPESADYIAATFALSASPATTPDQSKFVPGAQLIFKSSDTAGIIYAVAQLDTLCPGGSLFASCQRPAMYSGITAIGISPE